MLTMSSSQERTGQNTTIGCTGCYRNSESGLTLNEKCQFALTEVRFLGHVINSKGIRADPDKIKAIRDMPEPKDVADVRRFMGMVNFVGKFVGRIIRFRGG